MLPDISHWQIFSRLTMVIILGLIMIFYLIMTLVLDYHWKRYAIEKSKLVLIRIVYFSVSGFLGLIILVSLYFFYVGIA